MFKDRLKELRLENEMSQVELATKLNISSKTVSGYENGVSQPDIQLVIEIANLFKVTTDYLIGNSNFKNIEEESNYKGELLKLNEILQNLNPVNRKAMNELFFVVNSTFSALIDDFDFDGLNNEILKKYTDSIAISTMVLSTCVIQVLSGIMYKPTSQNQEKIEEIFKGILKSKDKAIDQINKTFNYFLSLVDDDNTKPTLEVPEEFQKIFEQMQSSGDKDMKKD